MKKLKSIGVNALFEISRECASILTERDISTAEARKKKGRMLLYDA